MLHYHADHLGSTQLVTRMSAPWDYRHTRYGAYGEVRGHYGATPTPRPDCGNDGYCRELTGYDTEPRSGLAYAQARFYDPALGLFLTHDPAREYASPYTYVGWDPVNRTDPSGAFDLLFWVAVALVAGFAAGSIQAAVEGAPGGEVVGRGITGALSSGVSAGIGAAVVGPLLETAVVGPLASTSGWSQEVVRQTVQLTALGGSVGQAAYGLSQGDYSGLVGLGLTIGLTYAFAASAAEGGTLSRSDTPGAQSDQMQVTPERVDESLTWLKDSAAKVGSKGLPRDAVSISPEDIPGGSGFTRCGVFGCSQVVLDPVMRDQAELTATLWHEARHFNAGFWERDSDLRISAVNRVRDGGERPELKPLE